MIAVIFEVWPKPGKAGEYFEIAASLRGELMQIDGFISIERFESVSEPGKFLSISFWRDEAAVAAWRGVEGHRNAQAKGRLNGEFLAGNTEELLPRIMGKYLPDQLSILLDPPRTGCRPEVLDLLREIRPKQVLYVSCHPATLARDLNILTSGGVFELKQVTPLDMFPQTQHVECVADVRGRV